MRTVKCPTCEVEIDATAKICPRCQTPKTPLRTCNACSGLVSITAVACPRCGNKNAGTATDTTNLRLCPGCGHLVHKSAYECPSCGYVCVKWSMRSTWFRGAAIIICLPVLISFVIALLYILASF